MTDEKLRTRIHQAIDARLSGVADDLFLAQRIAANAKGETPMKKKFAAFPVFVTAIVLLTLTVAVAVEGSDWRVLDWLSPELDNPYESVFPETTGDTSHPAADIRIREAVTDGYGVYVSVICTPKEEKTILLNASVTPRDDASVIGLVPDYPRQTIGAWADKHGYQLYDVRLYTVAGYADMSNNTGFDSVFGMMQRDEDGSTVIMMGGGSMPLQEEYQLNYIITPYEKQRNGLWMVAEWAVADQQQSITFSIDVPVAPEAEVVAEYAVSPDTPTRHINLNSCRILRTPLAAYVEYVYSFKDESVAQMDRWINDQFNLAAEHSFWNGEVQMAINAREVLPDGAVQFRCLKTITLPDGIPDEAELDATLFIPGSEDDLEERVTLVRTDK